jgi:hypothetical protein
VSGFHVGTDGGRTHSRRRRCGAVVTGAMPSNRWRGLQGFVDATHVMHCITYKDTAAAWFSSFLLNPLVSRVKHRDDMRTDRFGSR